MDKGHSHDDSRSQELNDKKDLNSIENKNLSFENVHVESDETTGMSLPISEPTLIVFPREKHRRRSSKPTSRRNSWINEENQQSTLQQQLAGLSLRVGQRTSRSVGSTPVEALSPSATCDHVPLPPYLADQLLNTASIHERARHRDDAAVLQSSLAVASRRSSCPPNLAPSLSQHRRAHLHEPSAKLPETNNPHITTTMNEYIHTPAVSPRHHSMRVIPTKADSMTAPMNAGDDSAIEPTNGSNSSSSSTLAHSTDSIPPPLLNLLLLGDKSCGLGAALDAFVGSDHNIGIACKTRIIRIGSTDYRVRCWHTPGEPSTQRLGTLLRKTHAIMIIFDEYSRESFHSAQLWCQALSAYADQHHHQHTPRPVLIVRNTAAGRHHTTTTVDDLRRGIDRRPSITSETHTTESDGSSAPTNHPCVAPSAVDELVQQLRSTYAQPSLISSFTLDAYLWRQRYDAFSRITEMAIHQQEASSKQSHQDEGISSNSPPDL